MKDNAAGIDTSIPINFGKHKGTAIEDLPTDYLIWLCDNVDESERKWDKRRERIMQAARYEYSSRKQHG